MKDLFKKWLSGNTTWKEEKKLRQVAEKDSFLAEAMEGYDTFPLTDHTAKIEQLKGRFNKQQKQEKGIIFSLPKVAAAAAIIGIIGTFFWVQREVQQPTVLSQNLESPKLPPSLQNSAENIAMEDVITDQPSADHNPKPTNKNLSKPIIQQASKPNKTTSKITNKTKPQITPDQPEAEIASNQEVLNDNIPEAVSLVEASIVPTKPEIEATTQIATSPTSSADIAYSARTIPTDQDKSSTQKRSKLKKEAARIKKINYYVGQVRNEDGQPMHKVKITSLNTKVNTFSKLNGEFILEVDSPLQQIIFSKDGFHTRKINIDQYSDFLNVSIVRKSTFPEDDAVKRAEMLDPKPIAGFEDFFKYLRNNRNHPVEAKEKGIERDVEIHFFINENGTPTDLKVANPDGYGFDKEAIRLLENGPKWMPTNSHARYYIPFELE